MHVVGYCLINKNGMVPLKRGGVIRIWLTEKGAKSKLMNTRDYFVAPVGIEDHVMVAEALEYLNSK